jgi:IS5 family transposase
MRFTIAKRSGVLSASTLNVESTPDATTLLKFLHLLEAKGITRQIFDTINGHLAEKGLMMREGTVVDATLIVAPPSTKNKDGERDPEMHQSKKGNDWHFGMKTHIGVDAASGLVHTLIGTAGNVADVTQAHALLHGDETAALGDAGYQGVEKRAENLGKSVTWHVAMKRSKRKALPKNKLGRMLEKLEHLKGERASISGASLPCHQEPVPASEDALSRPSKEHGATVYTVRLRQSGAGWPAIYDHRNPKCVLSAERRNKYCQFAEITFVGRLKKRTLRLKCRRVRKWRSMRRNRQLISASLGFRFNGLGLFGRKPIESVSKFG